jgi:integrase/recombinase XerD
MSSLASEKVKNRKFVVDKIFHPLDVHFDTSSLSAWFAFYYQVHVKDAPQKTEQAKQKDLAKFLNFFQMEVGA